MMMKSLIHPKLGRKEEKGMCIFIFGSDTASDRYEVLEDLRVLITRLLMVVMAKLLHMRVIVVNCEGKSENIVLLRL